MTRGFLSKGKLEEIGSRLPNAVEVQSRLLACHPEMIATKVGPDGRTDIAVICLQDASEVACEVGYALREAHASLAWYREESPKAPDESAAAFYCRFYLDDVALRLYAAAEHAANFIVEFLDIEESELNSYKGDKRSRATTVGKYMIVERPTHPITRLIQDLICNQSWRDTIAYRNTWVHEQPPLIEGTGIRWRRQGRWKKEGTTLYVEVRLRGDETEYTIDELLDVFTEATHEFIDVLSALADILIGYLEDIGVVQA